MTATSAENPKVSFVIPCYKLAHLLGECVRSILAQTYDDFEILIMDDASPDNTMEVASSFGDERVQYIRNPQNLGNLENYNKGIHLSRGAYVWLISADDYLIKPYVLARYVELMNANPNVGYTFCPGVSLKNGQPAGITGTYSSHDCVIKGHHLLKRLMVNNFILAASVLVRRECYKTISVFPLESDWKGTRVEMRWLGDWYLWCLFALAYDVGYFAEPMVCYREHDLSMSNSITQKEIVKTCADSDLGMLWMVRQRAADAGLDKISADCMRALVNEYYQQGVGKRYRASTYAMSVHDFEKSIDRVCDNESDKVKIRARFFEGAGDRHFSAGDILAARGLYSTSLRNDLLAMNVYLKLLLLLFGNTGTRIRNFIRNLRSTHALRAE